MRYNTYVTSRPSCKVGCVSPKINEPNNTKLRIDVIFARLDFFSVYVYKFKSEIKKKNVIYMLYDLEDTAHICLFYIGLLSNRMSLVTKYYYLID